MISIEKEESHTHRAAALVLVLGVGMMIGLPADFARADQDHQPPMTAVGYQNGTITGIYETTFQIDGKTFSLTPDAVLLDDTGKELDAGALVVTAEVKYRLKKDESHKIDRMVVYLPR